MNQFQMGLLVGILLIIAIGSIIRARGGHTLRRNSKPGRTYGAEPADDAEKQRLREEVQALKERVAVLERIATDSGSNLAQEIERLRDR